MEWALERDMIDANPAAGVRVQAPESRDRVLTDSELVAIWRAFEADGFPFGQFGKLLLLTAGRRDEVIGLKWSEIDIARREWTLPADRTGMGASRHQFGRGLTMTAVSADVAISLALM